MNQHTVLLLGATGRTGRRTLEQLLERGVRVRAIVRSATRLPAEVRDHAALTVVEADVLAVSDADLAEHLRGCDAVISCLGHSISVKGVFGRPRDLVTQATTRVCRTIEALQPADPVTFVLMSSVSVNRPSGLDTRRGMLERAFLWMLRGVLPPARDNQRAADFLCRDLGTSSPFVRWVAIRPDSLLEEHGSAYTIHEGLVDSLFAPGSTDMWNVAHLMCDLVGDSSVRDAWAGKMPVIVNVV